MQNNIVLILGVLSLALIVGFINYKSAWLKGKKLYCNVHCKDERTCDFF